MTKRWNIMERPDPILSRELGRELGISPKLAALLLQRGIATAEEARMFFAPSLSELHNPLLMKDMMRAVQRLHRAIENGEKILVYGDYDVDGTTAVAIVYQHLLKFAPREKLDFYVPERYKEGYGISQRGVDYAADNGFSLVIALDCGIKAVPRIEYANKRKVDFIICDHHTPGESLPAAAAVIDSKRTDDTYPDKNLSGCGVGFKLMQAYNIFVGRDPEELFEYLDLLAVSIASDIVPMTGENRILAYHGLKKINEDPCAGLRGIIAVSQLGHKRITVGDVVFKIGPRINAAGRMTTGLDAVRLLVGTEKADVIERSRDIDRSNKERMELDCQTTAEAKQMLMSDPAQSNRRTTVLFNPTWMKGIVGIVASRLTEEFYRPTIILTESQGLASGSARSVEGYDLYSAIDACSDLLENFGGHMYAAGLTLKIENVEAFKQRFEEYVAATITPEQREPQIDIDMPLEIADITQEFYDKLSLFEPFGPCNPKPTFCTERVYDRGNSRVIGKDFSHLKLDLIDSNSPATIGGIAFGIAQHYNHIQTRAAFDICYNIDENTFGGKTSLQLMVKDIRY